LFNWHDLKDNPDPEDMLFLLTTQYHVRVDVHRKIIQHVVHCCDDSMQEVAQQEDTAAKKQKTTEQ
jgi:hypothetical protein